MFSNQTLESVSDIRDRFRSTKPFRHVSVDNFLDHEVASRLLDEFPAFAATNAKNEFGKVGGKAVKSDLRSIGPEYTRLFEFLASERFLYTMSDMLGIPGLVFDPAMYGGGTHENVDGQELDPHVDFNYDQQHKLHRRVNLLIYLNREWDESWGGAIELHSDPWDWERDEARTFNCVFNRLVAFETNEHSWHGFKRIELPADKKYLTRKCISIYLYTKDRPADEIAPLHGTFYVQRPLPQRLSTGTVLTDQDIQELRGLLKRRDSWIRFYQGRELANSTEREEVDRYIASLLGAVRLPVKGYVSQVPGSAYGCYPDGWIAPDAGAKFVSDLPVTSIRVSMYAPPGLESGCLQIRLDGNDVGRCVCPPGQAGAETIAMQAFGPGEFALAFVGPEHVSAETSDQRKLSVILSSVEFGHPPR